MMKKLAIVMTGLFVFSTLSFAGEGKFADKKKDFTPEQKAKWEKVQKERNDNFNKTDALITKYNKASDKDKPKVKKELTAHIKKQNDKKSEKHAEFMLSKEGQAKWQNMKDFKAKDKKEFKKGSKKDFKKDRGDFKKHNSHKKHK